MSTTKIPDEEQPLLEDGLPSAIVDVEEEPEEASGGGEKPPLPTLLQEIKVQGRISVPLAVGLIANFLLSVISLSFVGHLGTKDLAAAMLGSTLYQMSGKILLQGLLGALDTYGSQAVGAGNWGALGSMFKQAVLWLMLHTIPIGGLFFLLPALLKKAGQEPELAEMSGRYLMALFPAIWIDAIYRPFNRILVAQHVTLPQMWVSCFTVVLHFGITYLFVFTLGWGFLGAARATVLSSAISCALVAAYIQLTGLYKRVWATPNGIVFTPWKPYIKLSYAAGAMMAIESWSLSICTVVVGFLPVDATPSMAAMAVANSIYGIVATFFGSLRISACTRVGNGLGAGSAPLAKLSARAAAVTMPCVWAILAAIIGLPPSQRLVIAAFTSSTDPVLLIKMRHLLHLLLVLMFFDGGQGVLSGMAAGAGKQSRGFLINACAHWVFALPTALLLGFHFKLGVEGLFSGIVLGPIVQWLFYGILIWRLNWAKEAAIAHARMMALCDSANGAGI